MERNLKNKITHLREKTELIQKKKKSIEPGGGGYTI